MRRFMFNHSKKEMSGFTLIEMLIIAPAVILLIGTLIALLATLTGESLQTREKAKMIYAVEATLKRFDQDTRSAFAFDVTSFAGAPNAQSANGAGAVFDVINQPYPTSTTPFAAKRILRTYATDKSPLDQTRQPIYSTSPNASACGTASQSQNNPLEIQIIYYMKYDSGPAGDARYSLWRRIMHNPAQTPCAGSVAWQRPSCEPGYTDSACRAEDEKLIDSLPVSGITGYYARIPDRSWTVSAPYAPTHYLDCINPCSVLNGNAGNPVLDPYSRDGSNNPVQNAKMATLTLNPVKSVAGSYITYYATGYSKRQELQ